MIEGGSTIVIPREVYYRCIWLIRDMPRLEQLVLMRQNGADGDYPETADISEDAIIVPETVIDRAAEDLETIKDTLNEIPEVYRQGIINNIISKDPFSDFAHPNTWKKWKTEFIHELARAMHYI